MDKGGWWPRGRAILMLWLSFAVLALWACETTETTQYIQSRWRESWAARLTEYTQAAAEYQQQEEALTNEILLTPQEREAGFSGMERQALTESSANDLIQLWYNYASRSGRIALLKEFSEFQATDPTSNMTSAWMIQRAQYLLNLQSQTTNRLNRFITRATQRGGYEGNAFLDARQAIAEHGVVVGAVDELILLAEEHKYYMADLEIAKRRDEEIAASRSAAFAAALLGLAAAAAAASE